MAPNKIVAPKKRTSPKEFFALLTFEADEDAGLGVIFMLVLSAYALLIWGAVLVVVTLIRKLLHKK